MTTKCKEFDIYFNNDIIKKRGQPMKNNKIEQIVIANNLGILFANKKFRELLLKKDKDINFIWLNFPEIYEFQVKNELRIFYSYDSVTFEYLEEICVAAFIDEGYRLKENHI